MNPGPARILICPECGGTKEVMTLLSGNTFRADFWSDGKMRAPMLPQPSLIQKCPHCGNYFWMPDQELKTVKDYRSSFELGELTYSETKEGAQRLLMTKPDEQKELDIRFMLIHAYNDEFVRLDKEGKRFNGRSSVPTEEDKSLFKESLERAYELSISMNYIVQAAEMLRELGKLDECIALINGMENLENNNELEYASQISNHAKKGISTVFYFKGD